MNQRARFYILLFHKNNPFLDKMVLDSDDARISIQVCQMEVLVQSVKTTKEQLSHGLLWNYALLVNWTNVWTPIPDTDAKPTILILIHLMNMKMNCKKQEVLQLSDSPMTLHLLYVRYVQNCPLKIVHNFKLFILAQNRVSKVESPIYFGV